MFLFPIPGLSSGPVTIVIPLVTVVMHLVLVFLLNLIFLPKASLYNNIYAHTAMIKALLLHKWLGSPASFFSLPSSTPVSRFWSVKKTITLDLSPTDYHLFKHLNNSLKGKCFHNQQETENAFQEFIKSWSTDFYATRINKLISHWQKKCVDCNTSYFD